MFLSSYRPFASFSLVLLGLGIGCPRLAAQQPAPPKPTITVPNTAPDDTQALVTALGLMGSGYTLRFQAGTYDFFIDPPLTGKRESFSLAGLSLIRITGTNPGTTLVFHGFDPNAPPWNNPPGPTAYPRQLFLFEDIQGLTIENLRIEMTREPYSTGVVFEKGATPDGRRYFKLQMNPPFADLQNQFRIERIDDYDSTSPFPHRLRSNHVHVQLNTTDYTNTVDTLAGTVTVTSTSTSSLNSVYQQFRDVVVSPVPDGLVLMHSKHLCHFLLMKSCSHLIVRNVRVQEVPGSTILAYNTDDVTIDNVDLVPHPDRLMSTTGDGFHLYDCTGTIAVRNCNISANGDDGLNVHSKYLRVCGAPTVTGSTVTVPLGESPTYFNNQWTSCGISGVDCETVEFFTSSLSRMDQAPLRGFVANNPCGAPSPTNPKSYTATFLAAELTPLPQIGDFAANLGKAPASVLIENCVVENNIARGVTLHGPDVTVRSCQFRRNTGPAIMMEAEVTQFFEASPADGLLVENCVIEDSNRFSPQFWGAVTIVGLYDDAGTRTVSPAGLHRNIEIRNNQFIDLHNGTIDTKPRAALWVTSSHTVDFIDNTFTGIAYDHTHLDGAGLRDQNLLRLERTTDASSPGNNCVTGYPGVAWHHWVEAGLDGGPVMIGCW